MRGYSRASNHSKLSEMDDKYDEISDRNLLKRLLLIVGISLVSISVIFVLCWFVVAESRNKSTSNGCLMREDSKFPNQLSEMQQIKLATPDFTTLVSLSGFLKYTNEDADFSEYLPLKLHNITHSSGQNGESALVLWTGCAKLTLNLASNSKQLVVGSIEVSTAKVGEHRRECTVPSTSIKLQDLTSHRYLCNTPASYECKASFWHNSDTYVMKTAAILELRSLEFEIEGDPNVIQTNQFSKKPLEC